MFHLFTDIFYLRRLSRFITQFESLHALGLSEHETIEHLLSLPMFSTHPKFQGLKTHLHAGLSLFQGLIFLLPPSIPLSHTALSGSPDTHLFIQGLSEYLTFRHQTLRHFLDQIRYPALLFFSFIVMFFIFFTFLLPTLSTLLVSLNPSGSASFISKALLFYLQYQPFVLIFSFLSLSLISFYFIQFLYHFLNSAFFLGYGHYFWILSLLLRSGFSLKSSLYALQLPREHPLNRVHQQVLGSLLKGHDVPTALSYFKSPLLEAESLHHSLFLSTPLPAYFLTLSRLFLEAERQHFTHRLVFIQPLLLLLIGFFIFGLISLTFFPILNGLSIQM